MKKKTVIIMVIIMLVLVTAAYIFFEDQDNSAEEELSTFEGLIFNPFTGEPHADTAIGVLNMDNENYYLFEDVVDKNGLYSVSISPGYYYITLYLDMGEEDYYAESYSGSNSNFRSDNILELKDDMVVEINEDYSLDFKRGVLKGQILNLGTVLEVIDEHGDKVVAKVNTDGSFMTAIPEGLYEINVRGHALRRNIKVENGEVTDIGTLSI